MVSCVRVTFPDCLKSVLPSQCRVIQFWRLRFRHRYSNGQPRDIVIIADTSLPDHLVARFSPWTPSSPSVTRVVTTSFRTSLTMAARLNTIPVSHISYPESDGEETSQKVPLTPLTTSVLANHISNNAPRRRGTTPVCTSETVIAYIDLTQDDESPIEDALQVDDAHVLGTLHQPTQVNNGGTSTPPTEAYRDLVDKSPHEVSPRRKRPRESRSSTETSNRPSPRKKVRFADNATNTGQKLPDVKYQAFKPRVACIHREERAGNPQALSHRTSEVQSETHCVMKYCKEYDNTITNTGSQQFAIIISIDCVGFKVPMTQLQTSRCVVPFPSPFS